MDVKNVIVICDFGSVVGGAERIAIDTALILKKSGINVEYFCAINPIDERLISSGVNVSCLNHNGVLKEKKLLKKIRRGINNKESYLVIQSILKKYDPSDTVIHIHNWTKGLTSSIFRAFSKSDYKVFITFHDYFAVCPNGGLYNYKKGSICGYSPMSLKCVLCNCDSRNYLVKLFRLYRFNIQNKNLKRIRNLNCIYISDFSKRELLKRRNVFSEKTNFMVNNPISFEENSRIRIKCEDNNTILFIGAITEVKGIDEYCEAISKFGLKGIVIGDGKLKTYLEKKYPDIRFVGWKSKTEMMEFYKEARMLVFPSKWYEGSPLTPLEVMAYGIPVVCSNVNAASDYINELGGFIYDIDDDLGNVISSISNSQIKSTSEKIFANFNTFLDRFTYQNYLNNLLECYNK